MNDKNNRIDKFVHGGMLVLHEDTPAFQAARAMHERRVGAAVVCDHKGHVTGIVTDRDLATQVLAFEYPMLDPISDFMTVQVQSVSSEASIRDVTRIMETYGVRRVPVLRRTRRGTEKCVGMVSLDDLIVDKAVDNETLSRIVSRQVFRPTPRIPRSGDNRAERLEHKLNIFYRTIAENTRINRPLIDDITYYVLGALVERLPATGAAQFLTQLPKLLQDDLLDRRAGPNRQITAESLIEGMRTRFALPALEAEAVVEGIWTGIEAFTCFSGEENDVLDQLPADWRELLT